jgi:regulator of cell morphogenesis and NO signaling
MTDTATRTLGDLVAEVPARAAVLDRLGLDYCCHGDRPLAVACETAGIPVDAVTAELAGLGGAADTRDYPDDPAALADHIEAVHHGYLHRELPELVTLAEKVAGVHGERHPELDDVRRLVIEVQSELDPHLQKEERVLFPAVRALAAGQGEFTFGTIGNPIRMMAAEHDRAGELLADLRSVSGGYRVPDDGCASYRSLYERLEHLEADTHRHIHLENNVLFPAALAMEAAA